MSPATTNIATSPSTMTTARRPSSVSAWDRVRSPGAITAQPERETGAGGHDDRGELERAVRQDQAPEREARRPR